MEDKNPFLVIDKEFKDALKKRLCSFVDNLPDKVNDLSITVRERHIYLSFRPED